MVTNPSQTIPIDRNAKFTWGVVHSSYPSLYSISWNDPGAESITSLEVSEIELVLLFEGQGTVAEINHATLAGLEGLQKSGAVLLDAYVCRAMLARPALIPKEWWTIADSDSEGGSIRFDGSIFRKNEPDAQEVVLAPYVARGHWTHGFEDRLIRIGDFGETEKIGMMLYTAVKR